MQAEWLDQLSYSVHIAGRNLVYTHVYTVGPAAVSLGSNHFNYAHFDHRGRIFKTLCATLSTLIVNHYLDSATLYHTLSHFLTIFSLTDPCIDAYTQGGMI